MSLLRPSGRCKHAEALRGHSPEGLCTAAALTFPPCRESHAAASRCRHDASSLAAGSDVGHPLSLLFLTTEDVNRCCNSVHLCFLLYQTTNPLVSILLLLRHRALQLYRHKCGTGRSIFHHLEDFLSICMWDAAFLIWALLKNAKMDR